MSYKMTEIHKFRDERLHLYKRSDCKFWMCRFFADGKYKTSSTKETSFSSGKKFALEWYDKLRFEAADTEYQYTEELLMMLLMSIWSIKKFLLVVEN